MVQFGRSVIIESVYNAKLHRYNLYEFSASAFVVEVTESLLVKFSHHPLEVVRWYAARKNHSQATQFTRTRLSKLTNKELCSIALILPNPSDWVSQELHKRKFIRWYVLVVIGSATLNKQGKFAFVDKLRSRRGKLLLSATEESLIDLSINLFKEVLDDDGLALLVERHFQEASPWSDENLTLLVHTMKDVTQILKAAEPTSHVNDYPMIYAGLYKQVARRRGLLVEVQTVSQNDQPWLLRAFAHYGISIEQHVSTSDAVAFTGWALSAQLPESALRLSWKALSDVESAQANWPVVVDHWQSNEKLCAWLVEWYFGRNNGIWEILLKGNPRLVMASRHCCNPNSEATLLPCILAHYGSSIARYWWTNSGNTTEPHLLLHPAILQQNVDHVQQLRIALAERRKFVDDGCVVATTAITGVKKKKKKTARRKSKRKK